MTNFYSLSPMEKDIAKPFIRSYPVPTNAEEFEKFSIYKKVFERKWVVQLNESENDFLEIFVFDGHQRKNIVQIFTRALKTIACSCHDFQTNFLGYCDHVAVIERIIKGHITRSEETAWHTVMKIFQRLPPKRALYRGRQFRVYIPSEQEYIFIGKKANEYTDSVGCPTVEPFDYDERFDSFFRENKNISSKGLLTGVNLYDYQEEVFAKMLAAKRCICSMIMGSGKTITAIASYEWLRQNKNKNLRLLVIGPKSLKLQWGQEIKKCIGLDTVQINNLQDLERFDKNKSQIGAVTYQFASRHVDKFKAMSFDVIVLDEMQYIRNDETKAWKAISKLQAEYMFGLSGTIIENRLEDLYSVMEILAPNFLGPKWKFSTDYQNISVVTKSSIFFEGTRNIDRLRDKLKNFLFSYHKLDLPKLHHKNHFVKLNSMERNYHDGYYEQAKILMAKMMSSGLSPSEKLRLQALLLKSRQSTDTEQLITKTPALRRSGKLEKLLTIVEDICVRRDEKIVIFSSWTEMLDIIGDLVTSEFPGVGCVYFTGAESLNARKKSIDRFVNDKTCSVFLASDAGGLGVDGLQYAATTVVHFELPWNPAKIDQRNARLHRIGQNKEVISHYLIGADSVETQMLETLYKKRAVRNEVLYNDDGVAVSEVVEEIPIPKTPPPAYKPRLIPAF